MPFVTLYLPYGCDDAAIERSLREITAAGDATLENTLARMIRVSVYEYQPGHIYEGGAHTPEGALYPIVQFRVGPGRSDAAKDSFIKQITEILSVNLGCEKSRIRSFILDNQEGHHFTIGGKPKDFSKKVK